MPLDDLNFDPVPGTFEAPPPNDDDSDMSAITFHDGSTLSSPLNRPTTATATAARRRPPPDIIRSRYVSPLRAPQTLVLRNKENLHPRRLSALEARLSEIEAPVLESNPNLSFPAHFLPEDVASRVFGIGMTGRGGGVSTERNGYALPTRSSGEDLWKQTDVEEGMSEMQAIVEIERLKTMGQWMLEDQQFAMLTVGMTEREKLVLNTRLRLLNWNLAVVDE